MKITIATILAFVAGSASALAPLHTKAKIIPSQYIVVLRKDVDVNAHIKMIKSEMASISPVSEIIHKYEIGDFKGYAVRCSQDVLQFIRSKEDSVEFVEEDQFVSIFGSQSNPPSWGLDRIDQRNLPLNNAYKYPDSAGAGVTTYTLDTGIRITHKDFTGRAVWGFTSNPASSDDDINGHGTHCAAIMAGSTYGVAKAAKVVAVKVLGDSGGGTTSDVLAGVNWVTDQHKSTGGPSVSNMSLGSGPSTAVDNAVNYSVSAGVHTAVAAGNSNSNACNFSPARATSAVCVGGTTKTDRKWVGSNYGSCVDILAPGDEITSAYYRSDTDSYTTSGTSQACPHVAGVMALYLSRGKIPTIEALQEASTKNVTTGFSSDTVNYLIYTDDLLKD